MRDYLKIEEIKDIFEILEYKECEINKFMNLADNYIGAYKYFLGYHMTSAYNHKSSINIKSHIEETK